MFAVLIGQLPNFARYGIFGTVGLVAVLWVVWYYFLRKPAGKVASAAASGVGGVAGTVTDAAGGLAEGLGIKATPEEITAERIGKLSDIPGITEAEIVQYAKSKKVIGDPNSVYADLAAKRMAKPTTEPEIPTTF